MQPVLAGPPPTPPEQVQLQLFEFLSLLTRLCFLKANPRYGKKDPKGTGARVESSPAARATAPRQQAVPRSALEV